MPSKGPNIINLFLLICIFSLTFGGCERVLVSRPILTSYNQYGNLQHFTLEWKSYHTIYQGNYIMIVFPEPIHGTETLIDFSISTAHSLSVIFAQQSLPYVSSNTYYLPVSVDLSPGVWYQLKVKVETVPTISYGLVQMEVVGK